MQYIPNFVNFRWTVLKTERVTDRQTPPIHRAFIFWTWRQTSTGTVRTAGCSTPCTHLDTPFRGSFVYRHIQTAVYLPRSIAMRVFTIWTRFLVANRILNNDFAQPPCSVRFQRNFPIHFEVPLSKKIQDPTVGVVGRDSSVGIATRYGLDGPWIESRWGRDFQHLYRPTLVPIQPNMKWVPGFFPGGKAAGAWRWPSTQSSAEVKESAELYLHSPSGLSWPVLGWNLPFPFTIYRPLCHSCKPPSVVTLTELTVGKRARTHTHTETDRWTSHRKLLFRRQIRKLRRTATTIDCQKNDARNSSGSPRCAASPAGWWGGEGLGHASRQGKSRMWTVHTADSTLYLPLAVSYTAFYLRFTRSLLPPKLLASGHLCRRSTLLDLPPACNLCMPLNVHGRGGTAPRILNVGST